MAALITGDAGEFAAALGDAGKLAGLDVGTKTVGLAICDAGWHFAGPAETIRRIFEVDVTIDYTEGGVPFLLPQTMRPAGPPTA